MSINRVALATLLIVLVLVTSLSVGSIPIGAQDKDTITVRGRIFYYDFDASENRTPARGITVELYDRDKRPFPRNVILGVAQTDADGWYEIGPVSNRDMDGGRDDKGQDIFLLYRTTSSEIQVQDSYGRVYFGSTFEEPGIMYNVSSGEIIYRDFTVGFTTDPQPVADAIRVYSTLWDGFDLVYETTGQNPGQAIATWEPEIQDGPYYTPGEFIHLRGGDAAFPHVILHQLAHNYMWNIYGGSELPGGCPHGDHDADIQLNNSQTCAWVEGWAEFFAMAVTGDPRYYTQDLRLDLEEPTWGTLGWSNGDAVPGRVAGALWDLYDDLGDGVDQFTAGFFPIWDTFSSGTLNNFSEFWTAWRSRGHDSCQGVLSLYQSTVDYDDPPVITGLPDVVLDEDTSVEDAINLEAYAGDTDCGADVLAYAIDNNPDLDAGVSIDENNYVDINPVQDWFGTVAVRVRVNDGAKSATDTFVVTVNPINDAPFIDPSIPDEQDFVDTPIAVDLSPYGNDVDDALATLTWYASGLDNCTVSGEGTQVLTFTPTAGYEGNDLVVLTVRDPHGAEATQTLLLTWTPAPNWPPTISPTVPDQVASMNGSITIDLEPYGHDTDDPSDTLKWYATDMDFCTVSGAGGRVLSFIPVEGYVGDDEVTLHVRDTGGLEATQKITLTWTPPVNQPPTISPPVPDRSAEMGNSIVLDLTNYGHDVDDPDSSLVWYATGLDNCTYTGDGTRELTFYPKSPDFMGDDIVTLHVRDPHGDEATQDVKLTWTERTAFQIFVPIVPKNH